jgi:hypothetical protein
MSLDTGIDQAIDIAIDLLDHFVRKSKDVSLSQKHPSFTTAYRLHNLNADFARADGESGFMRG